MQKTSLIGLFKDFSKGKKINVFLVFFLLSFMVWMLVKLSKEYTDTVTLAITYVDIADDKIILETNDTDLDAQIKTTGFKMIMYHLFKKKIQVSLDDVKKAREKNKYYLLSNDAIDAHFYKETEIIKVVPDSLYLTLGVNKTKQVPVIPRVNINYKNGYSNIETLQITPKSISITGPENTIDRIKEVYTIERTLTNVSTNIDLNIPIAIENDLKENIILSQNEVKLTVPVEKFTEGRLMIPLQVLNLPEGYSIKLFPKDVEVVYTASISDFNEIKANDFSLVCDFAALENSNASYFIPKLIKKPKEVKSHRVLQEKINFLIKK